MMMMMVTLFQLQSVRMPIVITTIVFHNDDNMIMMVTLFQHAHTLIKVYFYTSQDALILQSVTHFSLQVPLKFIHITF